LRDEIRNYAIAAYRKGRFCVNGLNEALEHFDLDGYSPRMRLSYTISGSFEVDGDDVRAAEYDAGNYLCVPTWRASNASPTARTPTRSTWKRPIASIVTTWGSRVVVVEGGFTRPLRGRWSGR
jgi:hypothetical protein